MASFRGLREACIRTDGNHRRESGQRLIQRAISGYWLSMARNALSCRLYDDASHWSSYAGGPKDFVTLRDQFREIIKTSEEEVQQSIAALSSLQTPLDSALDVPFPPVGSTEHVDSDTPFLFTDLGMEVEWGNIPGEMDLGDSIHTTSAARTS
ncbi:uncharacterized protein LMH87_007948 [Akanthomyces muscarius]|uniref:Uncharacterized protein n=1 Tax=Akanthomyces muscarius TaxID=2231603 RepID=A0A9W8QJ78_AKAMU|nr:uncharacterized protein LMH87_007948 [Akanthomyces muscarius]KAJ4160013.1 hypothetical protein LMH87_007948 [Akanthomyces muscarius]